MRMWNIDPRKMCIQHLLGEHLEMHMFMGCIKKKRSLRGYISKGQVEIHNIIKRHNELSEELSRRSGNVHQTPMDDYDMKFLWEEGIVDSKMNEQDLSHRCDKCRELVI